jgi:hypothetical protein
VNRLLPLTLGVIAGAVAFELAETAFANPEITLLLLACLVASLGWQILRLPKS